MKETEEVAGREGPNVNYHIVRALKEMCKHEQKLL